MAAMRGDLLGECEAGSGKNWPNVAFVEFRGCSTAADRVDDGENAAGRGRDGCVNSGNCCGGGVGVGEMERGSFAEAAHMAIRFWVVDWHVPYLDGVFIQCSAHDFIGSGRLR